MKDQIWLSPDKTRNIFSKISLSPFKIPGNEVPKTPPQCGSGESSSSSSKALFFQKSAISKKKPDGRAVLPIFDLGDLEQMKKDFSEKKESDSILLQSKSIFQGKFSTPEKPLPAKIKSELKIFYGKSGANRTNSTPNPTLNLCKTPIPQIPNPLESAENPSSSNLLRLKIAPSYCFESQISEISPFTLGPTPSPIMNQNIVSTQPLCLDLDVNLDEVDALSFEAPGEMKQIILNPNNITGIKKTCFPQEKSGKIKGDQDGFGEMFFGKGKSQMGKASLGNCSRVCRCGTISMKNSGLRNSNLNLKSFVSNNRKPKYVSNRMKFEKQVLKKIKKKQKCRCFTQKKIGNSNQKATLFVSEFFFGKNKKVETPSNVLAFSHLDIQKLTIHKNDFFGKKNQNFSFM